MFTPGLLDAGRRPACLSTRRPALRPAPCTDHAAGVACGAKGKKGKKKGGGKQKKQGLLSTIPKAGTLKPYLSTDMIMQHFLMVECYARAAGKPLLEGAEMINVAQAIYEAPFAILAHNRFAEGVPDDEAVYTFANAMALQVFAAEWDDLVGTPSVQSVADMPEEDVAARDEAMTALAKAATAPGAEEDADDDAPHISGPGKNAVHGTGGGVVSISGWRRKLDGGRVRIEDGRLWNIRSPTGGTIGQAVWFDTVTLEDGRTVRVNSTGDPPTEEEIAAAEAAVAEQGDVVRALKESGKGNDDPDVAAAVAVLLERKATVAAMKDGTWERPEGAPAEDAPAAGEAVEAAASEKESAPAA